MRGAPGKQTVYCAAGWAAPPCPSHLLLCTVTELCTSAQCQPTCGSFITSELCSKVQICHIFRKVCVYMLRWASLKIWFRFLYYCYWSRPQNMTTCFRHLLLAATYYFFYFSFAQVDSSLSPVKTISSDCLNWYFSLCFLHCVRLQIVSLYLVRLSIW